MVRVKSRKQKRNKLRKKRIKKGKGIIGTLRMKLNKALSVKRKNLPRRKIPSEMIRKTLKMETRKGPKRKVRRSKKNKSRNRSSQATSWRE